MMQKLLAPFFCCVMFVRRWNLIGVGRMVDEVEAEDEADELFSKVHKAAEQEQESVFSDIKMGECWLHRNQNKRCACYKQAYHGLRLMSLGCNDYVS